MTRDLPEPSPLTSHWSLAPDIVYLNHGSFGACPNIAFEARIEHLRRVEAEAVRFYACELFAEMDRVRNALASVCGGDACDYVMLPNATNAVATVAMNTDLSPGDRVLMTEHEYPACANNLRRRSRETGAEVDVAPIPFPHSTDEDILESIVSRVTPKTKLALISHVTSTSGIALPIERLVTELRERNVRTLIDGAHAPGMLDVDLASIGADYYTANCHKWLCAPKGSAFLHVRRELQEGFRPLALSNFAESPSFAHPEPPRSFFNLEFDYVGTDDRTAIMTVPDAIDAMSAMTPGGWDEVRTRNHALVLEARDIVCGALEVDAPAPDRMIGSIASVLLPSHGEHPDASLAKRPTRFADALQDRLVDDWQIQIPVWNLSRSNGTRARFVRLSAQLYNSKAQYEYLAEALTTELARERSL